MMNLVKVVVLLVAAWCHVIATIGAKKASCDFPAIYNFGDSNSDTGATAAAFFPRPWPSGETFFGEPAGRSCNGRLMIDFIAEEFKLPLLSPYLDSIATSFRRGANFANGGSTIRQQNESFLFSSPFSFDVQFAQFSNFMNRTGAIYNHTSKIKKESRKDLPRPKEFANALYTIDVGQNDLSAGFRKMSDSQLLAAIPDILNQFSIQIQNLYRQGARIFWIHNTGPIGCLPLTLINLSNPPAGFLDQYGCVKTQNEMAVEFNKQLKEKVMQLRSQLPLAALTYVDIHALKLDLIANATTYGFVDPKKICCGYQKDGHLIVGCGGKLIVNGTQLFGASCEDPASYIFWDGIHYTEAANHWVASRIITGSFSDPPVAIAQACHPTA